MFAWNDVDVWGGEVPGSPFRLVRGRCFVKTTAEELLATMTTPTDENYNRCLRTIDEVFNCGRMLGTIRGEGCPQDEFGNIVRAPVLPHMCLKVRARTLAQSQMCISVYLFSHVLIDSLPRAPSNRDPRLFASLVDALSISVSHTLSLSHTLSRSDVIAPVSVVQWSCFNCPWPVWSRDAVFVQYTDLVTTADGTRYAVTVTWSVEVCFLCAIVPLLRCPIPANAHFLRSLW